MILFSTSSGQARIPISYARDYMVIILLGNVITHMYLGLNALLRASGHPQKAMIATITTVIINTILDPIFIYLFHWGIQGAAIATILAQIIALVWQFKTFTNKNELLHLHRGIYKLRGTICKKHHRYRYVSVPDESGSMLHCNFH